MATGYMASHMMTQHGQVAEARQSWKNLVTGEEPLTYRMAFPAKGGPRSFLVEGCPGRAVMRTAMRTHLLHRNVLDTVVILEEGKLPHPWRTQCDMLVPRRALNARHAVTYKCARGAEWKRQRLAEAELREISGRYFEAYGELL